MQSVLKDAKLQRNLLFFNGALPGLLLLFDWYSGNLGANPPEALIRTTGVIAIIFLVLSLAVTPLSQVLGWSFLIRHRRWLGLWCFYYALIHLVSYAIFDRGLVVPDIVDDIGKRPFILLGFLAFLILLPLAITSTNTMIKKLGNKRWKMLHRGTYVAIIAAAIHFWLIVKSDLFYPAIFASIAALLLGYRVFQQKLKKSSSLKK